MLSEVDEDGMFLENTELEVKSNLWRKRELPERQTPPSLMQCGLLSCLETAWHGLVLSSESRTAVSSKQRHTLSRAFRRL